MTNRIISSVLVATLLVAGVWTASMVSMTSDLARFMPDPERADERVLVEQLSNAPGARVLMLAITSNSRERSARLSKELKRRLEPSPSFRRIWNGDVDPTRELRRHMSLRFTHSPAMDTARFDRTSLADALRERMMDLSASGEPVFDELLAHDPQFLTLAMLDAWAPPHLPVTHSGVWFSRRDEALLLVETAVAGYDPTGQGSAIALIEATFSALGAGGEERVSVSGPGSFSVRMNERVAGEAALMGAAAAAGLIGLLLLAYRSPAYVLLSAVPLACAAAAGLIAVHLLFEEVHGITLAFAFTLIGVAQDYPVHLMSHVRPGRPARVVAVELWPTLRLGVLATIIAYLTLFSANAGGLAQLSVFTIVGLLAAALVTRFLLPPLMPTPTRDAAAGRAFVALARRLGSLRAGWWVALPFLALFAFAIHREDSLPWWSNDLSELTPIPADWLVEDSRLRAELLPPDVRSLLILSEPDRESLLRLSERLSPRFDDLRARQVIAGDDLPSRYFPSEERQASRIARLPAAESLRAALVAAAEEVGFEPSFFEPMIADVVAARASIRKAGEVSVQGASDLDVRLGATLREGSDAVTAIVALYGVTDAEQVGTALRFERGARMADLKEVAEGLVASLRERVLVGLLFAAAAFTALIGVALGWRGAARVLFPVSVALIATITILRVLGIDMTLFHLIALMLSVGLGIDYALFFHRFGVGADALRALHSVLVSAASTLLAFGLLALSAVPVLQAIGLTVAAGVCAQFTLALLLARDGEQPNPEGLPYGTPSL